SAGGLAWSGRFYDRAYLHVFNLLRHRHLDRARLGHYLHLGQGPGPSSLKYFPRIAFKIPMMTRAMDFSFLGFVANGTGKMCAFLFKGTPFVLFQMDKDIRNYLAPLNRKLEHFPYGDLVF